MDLNKSLRIRLIFKALSSYRWLEMILLSFNIIIAGFLLMGLTTLAIPFLSSQILTLTLWALLLFVGRIGASTVETMAETYFFKSIDGHNASLMGHFRRSRPLAFVIAPLLASILLGTHLVTLQGLFSILGVLMLCAIYYPLRLVDTK